MEKTSFDSTIPSYFVDFFSLNIVFNLFSYDNISSFLLTYWCYYRDQFFSNSEVRPDELKSKNTDAAKKQLISSREVFSGDFLFGRDINMVMEKLGIQYSIEGEDQLEKKYGYDELCNLFEEEPSLEEVKEAFNVFDQNKDGFIDAWELQRVLRVLGLWQGSELQACSKMIRAFDENEDGKLDINEFVRFLSNTL